MEIYVACTYAHRDAAKAVADALVKAGHRITFAWWENAEENGGRGAPSYAEGWAQLGVNCTNGVVSADLMVVLWFGPSLGTAMEMGIWHQRSSQPCIIFPFGADGGIPLDMCPFFYTPTWAAEAAQFYVHAQRFDLSYVESKGKAVVASNIVLAAVEAIVGKGNTVALCSDLDTSPRHLARLGADAYFVDEDGNSTHGLYPRARL